MKQNKEKILIGQYMVLTLCFLIYSFTGKSSSLIIVSVFFTLYWLYDISKSIGKIKDKDRGE